MQGIRSVTMDRNEKSDWMRSQRCGESSHCAELLDEGDGNVRLRSSYNRDRDLRLTSTEMDQIVSMWMDEGMRPAPAVVG